MNPQTWEELINMVKNSWSFLYQIAEKQLKMWTVSYIIQTIVGILGLIVLFWILRNFLRYVSASKKFYDNHRDYEDYIGPKFLNHFAPRDDEIAPIGVIGGICWFIIFLVNLFWFYDSLYYLINIFVNPNYMIFKIILEMIGK